MAIIWLIATGRLIQNTISHQLSIYTTVGIGEIHYETVPDKIWPITELTDIWGIGPRMAKHLNRLQIHNMYELVHTNPHFLKQNLGVISSQIFATSWGVDHSQLTEPIKTKEASLGNSQVLPRDYLAQGELETVIKEIDEQVAARLRHHHKLAGCLSLSIGFSYTAAEADGRDGFHHAIRIGPTK